MPVAYVSIGSNLRREANVRSAVRALRAQFGSVRLSRVYESEAQGFDGPDFLNLVAAIESELPLEELAARLRGIERDHGRRGSSRDGGRDGSRTLDLDLLLYGDIVRHDDRFDLPRGEIRRYAFVLRPLCDLAGSGHHPELGCTFDALWRELERQGQRLHAVDFDPESGDAVPASAGSRRTG